MYFVMTLLLFQVEDSLFGFCGFSFPICWTNMHWVHGMSFKVSALGFDRFIVCCRLQHDNVVGLIVFRCTCHSQS